MDALKASLALIVLILAGCALNNVDSEYSFKPESKKSLLIMSLTGSGTFKIEAAYGIVGTGNRINRELNVDGGDENRISSEAACEYFKNDAKVQQDIRSNPNITEKDTILTHCHGRIVVIEIPPGDYKLHQFIIFDVIYPKYVGYYDAISFPVLPIQVKFTILPRQILYIGNLHYLFNFNKKEEWFNISLYTVNHQERDFQLLKQYYPNIPLDRIKTIPLRF